MAAVISEKRADLHTHTTASDGILSPEELVVEAYRCRLSALAITDHDTLAGCQRAYDRGKKMGLLVIKGVEISCLPEQDGEELHILGFEPDPCHAPLRALLDKMVHSRRNRMKTMVEKARELNIDITLNEVRRRAGAAPPGRPHLADIMIEKGYVVSREEAFELYLNRGKPVYVSRYRPSPAEAIKILTKAGAATILAHPGEQGIELLVPLAGLGLHGVEVYHPRHSPRVVTAVKEEACRLGLLMSGGTDYHGPGGTVLHPGEISVPLEWAEAILSRAGKKG